MAGDGKLKAIKNLGGRESTNMQWTLSLHNKNKIKISVRFLINERIRYR